MSQHIDPTPKQTSINASNDGLKIKPFFATSIVTTSGTVFSSTLRIFYTQNTVVNISGRILLQNVEENTRPVLTFNAPSDCPIDTNLQFVAPLVRRGSTTIVVTDPCYVEFSSSGVTIRQFNFAGAAPAGWMEINF